MQEEVVGMPMEVDHITPLAGGGSSTEENLWLACPHCNRYKSAQTHGMDAMTGELVRLFNPRTQIWNEHFGWTESGVVIVGLTPTGRATVAALDMNNALIVRARRVWVLWGWHPPLD
jgi:hypothetical protein